MGYKLETHVHTIVSSACGHSTPAEMAAFYKAAGFDGICITEHFYLGNTCIDKELTWDEWVDAYAKAYFLAKKEGDRIGLDVFFGWETSYAGEDFLIYGLGPEWLKAHPDVVRWDQKEQYEAVHSDGGFVVQAHPFRERNYMTEIKLHPYHSDAWEVMNACNFPNENRLAYEEAVKCGKPMTAGSDIHRVRVTKCGKLFGLELAEPLQDIRDLKEIVTGGHCRLIMEESQLSAPPLNPWFEVTVFGRENERILQDQPYYPDAGKAEDPHERANPMGRVSLPGDPENDAS